MNREHIEGTIIRILRVMGLFVFIAIVAFPFYWMIVSSFRSLVEILLKPANLWLDIGKIDFHAYYEVLFEHGFLQYISNSVYVSVLTVLISVTLATLGGYAVTRLRFRTNSIPLPALVVPGSPGVEGAYSPGAHLGDTLRRVALLSLCLSVHSRTAPGHPG